MEVVKLDRMGRMEVEMYGNNESRNEWEVGCCTLWETRREKV